MADTPAADNLHAKTGSLATSSALAGYVTAAGGEHLVFAIFESGFVGDPPQDVEDALAVALAASDL
jgi:D-alanyl-D-alanine carboxypeptidase/D-alanyl-D-alanine-endopeptidase (penicillin-binding protein 4)